MWDMTREGRWSPAPGVECMRYTGPAWTAELVVARGRVLWKRHSGPVPLWVWRTMDDIITRLEALL